MHWLSVWWQTKIKYEKNKYGQFSYCPRISRKNGLHNSI